MARASACRSDSSRWDSTSLQHNSVTAAGKLRKTTSPVHVEPLLQLGGPLRLPGEQLGVERVGGVEGGVAVGTGGGRQQPGGKAHACNTAHVRYLDIQNRQL